MSNPWNKICPAAKVENLSEIMSEEYAKNLQIKEDTKIAELISDALLEPMDYSESLYTSPEVSRRKEDSEVSQNSDFVVAKVSQCPNESFIMDDKYNKEEKTSDYPLKLTDLSENYHNISGHLEYDESDSGNEEEWDDYEKGIASIPEAYDAKFSNSAMSLRDATYHEILEHKILGKEESIDLASKVKLLKLIKKGFLNINGVISTGKNSVVLHGTKYSNLEKPKECVIKVFKITNKKQDKYFKIDHECNDGISKRMWRTPAHLEMNKMLHLKKIGLNCPDVVILNKRIILMTYMRGKKLSDLKLLSLNDWSGTYYEVIDVMQKMFREGRLVHANLSERKILWWEKKCWFIDMSHSVDADHPNALALLLRDCHSILNFFKRKKVPGVNVMSAEDLLHYISGNDGSWRLAQTDVSNIITYNKIPQH